MRVACPCPPIHNDIVTPHHLLYCSIPHQLLAKTDQQSVCCAQSFSPFPNTLTRWSKDKKKKFHNCLSVYTVCLLHCFLMSVCLSLSRSLSLSPFPPLSFFFVFFFILFFFFLLFSLQSVTFFFFFPLKITELIEWKCTTNRNSRNDKNE